MYQVLSETFRASLTDDSQIVWLIFP